MLKAKTENRASVSGTTGQIMDRRGFFAHAAGISLATTLFGGCNRTIERPAPATSTPEPSPENRLEYIRYLHAEIQKAPLSALKEAEITTDPRRVFTLPRHPSYTIRLEDKEINVSGVPRRRDFIPRIPANEANNSLLPLGWDDPWVTEVFKISVRDRGSAERKVLFEMNFYRTIETGEEISVLPNRKAGELPKYRIAEPGSEVIEQIFRSLDDRVYQLQKESLHTFEEFVANYPERINSIPQWRFSSAENLNSVAAGIDGLFIQIDRVAVKRVHGKYITETMLFIDSINPLVGLHFWKKDGVDELFDAALPKAERSRGTASNF